MFFCFFKFQFFNLQIFFKDEKQNCCVVFVAVYHNWNCSFLLFWVLSGCVWRWTLTSNWELSEATELSWEMGRGNWNSTSPRRLGLAGQGDGDGWDGLRTPSAPCSAQQAQTRLGRNWVAALSSEEKKNPRIENWEPARATHQTPPTLEPHGRQNERQLPSTTQKHLPPSPSAMSCLVLFGPTQLFLRYRQHLSINFV